MSDLKQSSLKEKYATDEAAARVAQVAKDHHIDTTVLHQLLSAYSDVVVSSLKDRLFELESNGNNAWERAPQSLELSYGKAIQRVLRSSELPAYKVDVEKVHSVIKQPDKEQTGDDSWLYP